MSFALLTLGLMASAMAPPADDLVYQMTGPVVEVRDNYIVLQKGDDKWEIFRDLDTQGPIDISVGDTVTVQFTMNARAIFKQ